MTNKPKLGVIVPYRHRESQLPEFIDRITEHLNKQEIPHEIIIVEQDDGKQFNRGMLLNIGFKQSKQMRCDYVVFHDVDMLPLDVDYSYSDVPLHLATNFEGEKKVVFDEYFGGVTMFPSKLFEKIDGYSNKYWGWGYEDTDLLFRCKQYEIPLNTQKIKNQGRKGKALRFYGKNSKVICDNIIDFNSNATFFISFNPDDVEFNHLKPSDEFTVFSIPGYDFAICFNSFLRYNFCMFDNKMVPFYVNSNIKTNYKTNIVVTLDRLDNIIKVYQDGVFIGETGGFRKLYFYKKEPKFYLGVGKPDREETQNYYRGTIDSFAYFDDILSEKEISEISSNTTDLLINNFGDYKSSRSLKTYYDANHISNYKLIDLSGNHNDGVIKDCAIQNEEYDDYKEIKIPFRRVSKFQSLPHEENGFLGNKWKDQATRWNQLRYQNEVYKNNLIDNDGMSTLKFTLHGKTKEGNVTTLNVGL